MGTVSASHDATVLLEEGLRVLVAEMAENDPIRGRKAVTGRIASAQRTGQGTSRAHENTG
jgi:hypothetical protein